MPAFSRFTRVSDVGSIVALSSVAFGVAALVCIAPAGAQVTYRSFRPVAPTPYGYPVPYGYLQPDEVLGTSPSFEINGGAYGRYPAVRVVRRCQYPDGWNETDFVRDINGIPNGLDHTCPAGGPGADRAAY